jgi:hypothetical protein
MTNVISAVPLVFRTVKYSRLRLARYVDECSSDGWKKSTGLEDKDEMIKTERIFEKWGARMEGRWKWLGLFSCVVFS